MPGCGKSENLEIGTGPGNWQPENEAAGLGGRLRSPAMWMRKLLQRNVFPPFPSTF